MAALSRIMMVEDEPDIQSIAKMALEMVGGFKVEIASSGNQALEIVAALAPDLILLDVMMPGLDGPSTLKALRAEPATAAIPVVFMTAKAQPQEVAHFKELGALDVIAKPFDPMTLSNTIRDIWKAHYGN
ncbi:MAG: response regulator [Chloroflexi bacterium]|nr:response regulator [Chloroflexota bacterium]